MACKSCIPFKRERVIALSVLLSTGLIAAACSTETRRPVEEGARARSFATQDLRPPYPNVWEWVAPPSVDTDSLTAAVLTNGDVVIAFEELRDGGRRLGHILRYFEQRTQTSEVLTTSGVPLGDLTDDVVRAAEISATLSDGTLVRGDHGPTRENHCYAQLNGAVSITEPERRGQLKSLIYLYDKPRQWVVSDRCKSMDAPPDTFSYRAESMFVSVLRLEDDTFLLVDRSHGVVVRFDKSFRTGSRLLNRQVFVFDWSDLLTFFADSGFVEGEGGFDRLHEALNKHLEEISKR